jgi:mannosyltransferase OCH1-like enzyme
MILDNLSPRYDIPIKNYFELINNSNDDFHIVIYYLNDYKSNIIIRRLDDSCGWGINLKIKIFDIYDNSKFEILSIGSSNHNEKKLNFYTVIKLEHINYDIQKIPKVIFQTVPTKDINDLLHYNSIMTFIELNPEYEYKIFDDNDIRLFIKNNFDENTLNAFDLIVSGAFKADFFRYCYLYINGGCYFDCKQILRKPLRYIINKNSTLILCKDIDIGYFNAVMISVKNDSRILESIEMIKNKVYNFNNFYNIHDNNFGNARTILSFTGPVLLYQILNGKINDDNILLQHKNKNFIHEYQKLCIDYKDELFITKNYKSFNNYGKKHYSVEWRALEILYKDFFIIGDYKFYIYPFKFNDKYNIHIYNNNSILVERIDSNEGWGNNLKIKMIDEIENKIFFLEIGSSRNKFKLVELSNNYILNINNYIKTYKYDTSIYNDKFNANIVKCNGTIYNIIITRIDKNSGWAQNLNMEIVLTNDIKYNINIGNSDNQYKIIKLDF